MAWVLDLDGVVWRGEEAVAGAVEAIARLREAGERVVLVTNNSSATVGDYVAKLDRMGVAATADDLLTSAQAAAGLLPPGSTALACAGPGVVEALEARGVHVISDFSALLPPMTRKSAEKSMAHVDAVVVGWHRDFDFDRLTAAFLAIRQGARFVATNDDPTYPTPAGLVPGGGAIVAAVATAAGVAPEVAGKPFPPMVELVRARVGRDQPVVVVGDRASTDGLLARRLGARFVLVLSGVTTATDLPVEPEPDEVAPDLAAAVESHLAQ